MTTERNTYYYSGTHVPCFTILITELVPYGEYTLSTPIQALAYVYDLAGGHVQTVIACGATRDAALDLLRTTVAIVRENYMRECVGSVVNSVPILDPVVYQNFYNVGYRIADLLNAQGC